MRRRLDAHTLLPVAAGVILSALSGSPLVRAAPPTAEDFQIQYYLTDDEGDRARIMSFNDMQQFVNKARCECGQEIIARITLQQQAVDQLQTSAYIGQACGQAQANNNSQFDPCALLLTGVPNVFQNGPEYRFDPVWLASGTNGDQAISSAEPSGECSGQEASGGIWMCSGATECMSGNFFMDGTTNINVPDMESPQGIAVDFISPVTTPTNFKAVGGDGAVEISWEIAATGDINGYRVLCAGPDGMPVDTKDKLSDPGALAISNGTVYYTKDNLCPEGIFGDGSNGISGNGDGDGDGDGDTDGETDGETEGETDGEPETDPDACGYSEADTDWVCGGADEEPESGACPDGVGQQGACDSDVDTQACCTAGGDLLFCDPDTQLWGFQQCVEDEELPSEGIGSLGWDYVCSKHLGFNTTSARIEGLDNGVEYEFLVVAYDAAGNPSPSEVVPATPVETRDLWEQCEAQGDVCGEAGFCHVGEPLRSRGARLGLVIGLGLLGMGGIVGRRRRRLKRVRGPAA